MFSERQFLAEFPDINIEELVNSNRHPLVWSAKGLNLQRASIAVKFNKIIAQQSDSWGPMYSITCVALMLTGMAIELKLKAILLTEHSYPVNNQEMESIVRQGHSLSKLAKKTGFIVKGESARLMDQLTHFIEWGGKYPEPTLKKHFQLKNWSSYNSDEIEDLWKGGSEIYLIIASFCSDRLRLFYPKMEGLPPTTGISLSSIF